MDFDQPIRDLFLKHAKPGLILKQLRATMGALPLVLKALMDNSSKPIRIIMDGRAQTGSTDCTSVVRIPLVPLPTSEDDVDSFVVLAAFYYGLIHHEVGHINDTIPDAMSRCKDQLTAHTLNIIEDVRQENCHIQRFPAARKYLDALMMAAAKRGMFSYVEQGASPVEVFTSYLLFRLRAEFRDDPVATEFYPSAKRAMESTFTTGITVRMEPIISSFMHLQHTDDALQLAERLVAFVKDEKDKADQEEQQQQSQQNQPSQQGQAGSSSMPDQTQDDSDLPTPGNAGGKDDDADGDGKDDGSGSDSTDSGSSDQPSSAGDDPGMSSGAKALQDLLDAKDMDKAVGDVHEKALSMLNEALAEIPNRPTFDPTTPVHFGEINDQSEELTLGTPHDLGPAACVAVPLRRKLLSQLDAKTNDELSVGVKGRRLSGRHIGRVMTGDPRLFESVQEGESVNTAVMILEDVSGSMNGVKITVASQALYATATALTGIEGLDLAAMTFPGNSMVLRFGQSPRKSQSNFHLKAFGSTPMTESIQLATRHLLASRKARMIMIVLTDGEPDNAATAAAAIAVAESRGIEVFGVGILTGQFQHLFDRWTYIDQIQDLPEKLVAMIRNKVFESLAA